SFDNTSVSLWNLATDEYWVDRSSGGAPLSTSEVQGGTAAPIEAERLERRREINFIAGRAPRGLSIGRSSVDSSAVRRSVLASAVSPNGDMVAYGGYDRFVRIWSPATGTSSDLFHEKSPFNSVTALAFSSDNGRLVVGDEGGRTEVFNIKQKTRSMGAYRHSGR